MFHAHVALLRAFIAQRDAIIERLQGVLNAQQVATAYQQDRATWARPFEDAFFSLPGLDRDLVALRGQLQQAHWQADFQPRVMPGIPNEMFDPADMMTRAFTMWRHTRWPGRNGRVRFAQTLFNLYVVRCLALLTMRLWDDGPEGAGERLAQAQSVLDALWKSSPADQPVLVRDLRWLLPVAISPTTDDLGPYFQVAERVATQLPEVDRLEVHKAAVAMAGGHLRSQLRHFTMQGTVLTDPALLLRTRRSNALDCAMTLQALVPLLEAYGAAVAAGDALTRRSLASVICQGVSPDPDLFLVRLELLAAYSMIEHLFVQVQSGQALLTATGARHVALVDRYRASIVRLAPALAEDCAGLRPEAGRYSPFGVLYGFSSNLLEHMTMKALQPDAERRFSLEDVFRDGGAEELAWVAGWRRLPHVPTGVQKLYEYPQAFAETLFDRVQQALQQRAAMGAAAAHPTGILQIESGADPATLDAAVPVGLPRHLVFCSSESLAAAGRTTLRDAQTLRAERAEGEYLVSYAVGGDWVAVSKDLLTELLGAGIDVRIGGLPADAAAVLRRMCAGLLAGDQSTMA